MSEKSREVICTFNKELVLLFISIINTSSVAKKKLRALSAGGITKLIFCADACTYAESLKKRRVGGLSI